MRSTFKLMLVLAIAGMFSGCASYDHLKTGRKFQDFEAPADGQAKVYFLRDDGAMAAHPKLLAVNELEGNKKTAVAFLMEDTYVPASFKPGEHTFALGNTSERVMLAAGSTTCINAAFKFRGISVPVVEAMPNDECKKTLSKFDELVGAPEARTKQKGL